jgi:hypothetical protein
MHELKVAGGREGDGGGSNGEKGAAKVWRKADRVKGGMGEG